LFLCAFRGDYIESVNPVSVRFSLHKREILP
jgi:hypothetical protein